MGVARGGCDAVAALEGGDGELATESLRRAGMNQIIVSR